jgi:hypothetical protein
LDKRHNIFYTDNSWVDSDLTFHKYWQNEAMSVQTNVNHANWLIVLHVGGIKGYLAIAEVIGNEVQQGATMNKLILKT